MTDVEYKSVTLQPGLSGDTTVQECQVCFSLVSDTAKHTCMHVPETDSIEASETLTIEQMTIEAPIDSPVEVFPVDIETIKEAH